VTGAEARDEAYTTVDGMGNAWTEVQIGKTQLSWLLMQHAPPTRSATLQACREIVNNNSAGKMNICLGIGGPSRGKLSGP
jgi:hypothetical protein